MLINTDFANSIPVSLSKAKSDAEGISNIKNEEDKRRKINEIKGIKKSKSRIVGLTILKNAENNYGGYVVCSVGELGKAEANLTRCY